VIREYGNSQLRAISGPNREPRSQNVKLIGWQSVTVVERGVQAGSWKGVDAGTPTLKREPRWVGQHHHAEPRVHLNRLTRARVLVCPQRSDGAGRRDVPAVRKMQAAVLCQRLEHAHHLQRRLVRFVHYQHTPVPHGSHEGGVLPHQPTTLAQSGKTRERLHSGVTVQLNVLTLAVQRPQQLVGQLVLAHPLGPQQNAARISVALTPTWGSYHCASHPLHRQSAAWVREGPTA
jgi:hypothetical protein